MNLKGILKSLKLNENNISMLLGAAVIVIVGFLIVNYFKNMESGTTLPTGNSTQNTENIELPTTHTVAEGETLWSIAERYYKSGYNWVDIQKENGLANASMITKGQELKIPAVEAKLATVTTPTASASPVAMASASPEATVKPSVAPSATPVVSAKPEVSATPVATVKPTETPAATITGDSYTVVHGDNLWTIAVKAYGDGYKWTEIAKANKLLHPGVIHAGNVLTLPR